jgi:outer membrane protein TolC
MPAAVAACSLTSTLVLTVVGGLSLPQAREAAQRQRPELQVEASRLQARRVEESAADARWLPRVGLAAELVGSTANNTQASFFPQREAVAPRPAGKTVASGDFVPYPTSWLGLGAQQQLFDFGKTGAAMDSAKARTLSQEEERRRVALDIDLDVQLAWFELKAAHAVAAAAEHALERAKTHEALAAASVRTGLKPPIEETRVAADVARAQADLEQARGAVATGKSRLASAIGRPEEDVDVEGDGALPQLPQEMEDALKAALEASPVVREAKAFGQVAHARAQETALSRTPDLALLGSLNGFAGGPNTDPSVTPVGSGWLPVVPNYAVGVVAVVPLFDPVVARQAEADRLSAKAADQLVDVARLVESRATRAAWIARDSARKTLPALSAAEAAAVANERQADARFTQGLGTAVELADASQLRTEAEVRRILGELTVARTTLTLERSLGTAAVAKP